MKKDYISPYVIKRLPRYYRFMCDLIEEGKVKISSKELSERMKVTASQIRQDLNHFGEFGNQGYGYNVKRLRKEIEDILGIYKDGKRNSVIIIGAGNMGQAICDDFSFEKRGCALIGIFDKDPELHGKTIAGHKVLSMEELADFCEGNKPDIATLCVPKTSAKSVCEMLIALDVTNFWNFSHFDINVHFENVNVENVHLGDSLFTLLYSMNYEV